MSEAKIVRAIANFCQDRTLDFQIIIQDRTLHVYINRQNDDLDYQAVTSKIYVAVTSLDWLEVEELHLYSRILGKHELDWQTSIAIKKPGETLIDRLGYLAQEIETEVEDTGSLVTELSDKLAMPPSLTAKAISEISTTGSLAAELKNQAETKTRDTLAAELTEVPTEGSREQSAPDNSHDVQITNLTSDYAIAKVTEEDQTTDKQGFSAIAIAIWMRLIIFFKR